MTILQPAPLPTRSNLERRRTQDALARTIRFELAPSTLILLLVVAASLLVVIRLWPVVLVVVVALLVVGTLGPAVRWLEERHVRRGWGITLVFAGVFVAALLLVTLTIPSILTQAMALLKREPAFRTEVANHLAAFPLSASFAEWLRNANYEGLSTKISALAFGYSLRIFQVAAYGMSSIFLALYIMVDSDRLRGGLFAIVPRTHHLRLSRVMLNLERIVAAYIRGQLVTCLLIGAFTFILLRACGVENAMPLAVFAGIADVLPYIGAFLSIGPAVLAALGHSSTAAVIVLLMMLAYEEFESRVLIPRIYGHELRLPSSVVFFALLAGGTLMGLLGALLALPVAATIMMLLEELRVEFPGQQEQPADTEMRARDDLGEAEYERRTEGVGAAAAAAIAVEISADRRHEESLPAPPLDASGPLG